MPYHVFHERNGALALDVWIGNWNDPASSLAVSFEPAAYYWFIIPLVESLHERHGKFLDPYGGCEFRPSELHLFYALIDEAEALAQKQSERFTVHMGTQVEPVKKELNAEVDKDDFLAFLASLRDAAKQCERNGTTLHLYGD